MYFLSQSTQPVDNTQFSVNLNAITQLILALITVYGLVIAQLAKHGAKTADDKAVKAEQKASEAKTTATSAASLASTNEGRINDVVTTQQNQTKMLMDNALATPVPVKLESFMKEKQ